MHIGYHRFGFLHRVKEYSFYGFSHDLFNSQPPLSWVFLSRSNQKRNAKKGNAARERKADPVYNFHAVTALRSLLLR